MKFEEIVTIRGREYYTSNAYHNKPDSYRAKSLEQALRNLLTDSKSCASVDDFQALIAKTRKEYRV